MRVDFEIEIKCIKCKSNRVQVSLWAGQNTGLLELDCGNCDNKTNSSLDDSQLNDILIFDEE